MPKSVLLFFFLIGLFVFSRAQNDILVVKKKNKNVHSFVTGDKINMETIYRQQFKGIVTDMRHDSIFINGQPFHYREIAMITRERLYSGIYLIGTAMMVAGGGIIVLGAINGLYYRQDRFRDWYTTSALIIAPALVIAGYFVRKLYFIKYKIGKRFMLQYIATNTPS